MFALSGCSSLAGLASPSNATLGDQLGQQSAPHSVRTDSAPLNANGYAVAARETVIEPGQSTDSAFVSSAADPVLAGKQVELNFVDTDVHEFARILFSQVLNVPYLIDPNISGTVTVRSGGKIDGNRALGLARQALESSGNTIRVSDGIYKVTSMLAAGADAANLRTFNLSFIDPAAAQAALQGIIDGRAQVVSTSGNSLTMRGDAETLSLVASMIAAIDVDRFRSASFGLFPLKNGAAGELADELRNLYTGVGIANQTILPIDRINAILVVATKPDNLKFAQKWIDRLDQGPQNQRLVYVYQVKNRDAEELGKLLQGIFSAGKFGGGASPTVTTVTPPAEGESLTAPGAFLGPPAEDDGVKITADPGANKLVIWATKSEYALIDQALRRLDTPLSQVYVEATIAEVRLDGALSHGVRWFLQANGFSGGFSDADNGAIAPSFPGFNASVQVPEAELVISALESHTSVKIVSTPQLTVVDRETATIQVGDQVPVVTKSVQDASTGGTVIANDVTFRDTGVILKVTPQIRSSGEVLLDIAQEVSRVVPTTSSQIDSPTISQRKVASTVLVPDGQAIVLAGLMSSSDEDSGGGLPGTKGTLLESIFGSKKEAAARSELIVIIRPVIIRDQSDLRDVASEVASKMRDVMSIPVN
jgi:general secretion pathway protein D